MTEDKPFRARWGRGGVDEDGNFVGPFGRGGNTKPKKKPKELFVVPEVIAEIKLRGEENKRLMERLFKDKPVVTPDLPLHLTDIPSSEESAYIPKTDYSLDIPRYRHPNPILDEPVPPRILERWRRGRI